MDKQCKEWCLINHPENKPQWIWNVSMFRNAHHDLFRFSLEKKASRTWRCMDDFYKTILRKDFSQTLTVNIRVSNSLWHQSCLASIDQQTPISKNEFKEIVVMFEMTEGAVSFFEGGRKIEMKTLRNWTWYIERINSSICFEGLPFIVIGSLSLAAMNTKTGRKSSENETQPFCNHLWSISSRLTC